MSAPKKFKRRLAAERGPLAKFQPPPPVDSPPADDDGPLRAERRIDHFAPDAIEARVAAALRRSGR